MNSFGGYSSLDMQQRRVASAFALAQQRGWMQGGMATATSGYTPPYYSATVSPRTPVDAPATVVTEVKSAPERKRASFKSQATYWLVMTALSVLSIWPAWAPANSPYHGRMHHRNSGTTHTFPLRHRPGNGKSK